MSTTTAAWIAATKQDPKPAAKALETVTGGWDPYEVWRTRVLLPRLEAQETKRPEPKAATVTPLVPRQP